MRTCSDFVSHLPPLPLPEEMRAWDQGAVALGLPGEVFMENADRAALDVLRHYRADLSGKEVWLFMGGGNNGGDAACLARHLLDVGARPLVLHLKALNSFRGAAARHIRVARAAGVRFQPLRVARVDWASAPEILVDGLLGTGFSGVLRPEVQTLIGKINALGGERFVLSLDIPSGLDGRTGRPTPTALRASATATFAAAKQGMALPEALHWTGPLHVRAIGIPSRVRAAAPCSARLLDGRCLAALSGPVPGAYKNSFGHVLVLGGAPGYGGAAHLAARAALRAGAGLVTAAAPGGALADIKNGWAEIMTLSLGDSLRWPAALPLAFLSLFSSCAALVCGPGLGRGDDAGLMLQALLDQPHRPPTVFDADALVLLAQAPHLLAQVRSRDVLTPHPGEAATLLGCSAGDVQAHRFQALDELRALCRGTVVLKGAGTLAGQKDGPVLICPYDVPQLAVGGSGDVLAGCIGGLVASQGAAALVPEGPKNNGGATTALPAVAMGVALHALAGRSLAGAWAWRGNTASQIADALPTVLTDLARTAVNEEVLPWPQ